MSSKQNLKKRCPDWPPKALAKKDHPTLSMWRRDIPTHSARGGRELTSMLLDSVAGPSRHQLADVVSVNPDTFLYRRNHMGPARRLGAKMHQPDSGYEYSDSCPFKETGFTINFNGCEPLCQISVRIFSRVQDYLIGERSSTCLSFLDCR